LDRLLGSARLLEEVKLQLNIIKWFCCCFQFQ